MKDESVRRGFAPLTPMRRKLLDGLLDELLDLDADERRRRMETLWQRHPRIAKQAERLLALAESETGLYATSLERSARTALDAAELRRDQLPEGTRLGAWKIAALAGRGGMGLVYRAQRADGRFEKDVAIKLMRRRHAGFAERLASETRLLARLDHPSVARVIDGGDTGDGRAYMVMDWVSGADLDRYLSERAPDQDSGRADADARLALFEQIAVAVEHAHQRLVVHGDIKPGNVRVQEDGRAVLLDFGIARIVEDEHEDDAPLGFTPGFAAPEQREGQPATTQTDVWSLGALLYWMLGGEGRPNAPVDAALPRLPRRADLAAILNRALAEDPGHRYSGVSALLTDVRALREDRPVTARRLGSLGRLRLWTRRHRLAAALGALATVSIIAGVAAQVWQARIVAAERDLARFEANRSALLREQFVMLFREAASGAEPGSELSARELLDSSAALAEKTLASDPAALASVKAMFGEIYISMDDFAAAEPLLRSYVESEAGRDSPLLRAMVVADLAQIELRQGNSERALELTGEALTILENRPARATERVADVLGIRGQALRGLGEWERAIETLREAQAMARTAAGDRSTRLLARTANNLGTTLFYAGRIDEAIPAMEYALRQWRELGLADTSDALTVMTNLASLSHRQGRLDQAEQLYQEAIERRERQFGASGALGAAYLNYGSLLALRYRIDEARRSVMRGIDLITRFEGEETISHARGLMTLGRVLMTAEDWDRAAENIDRASEMFGQLVGDQHLYTEIAHLQQARVMARSAPDPARRRFESVIEALSVLRPASDTYLADSWCALARLEINQGRGQAALDAAEQCATLRREHFPDSSWSRAEARAIHAAARVLLGQEQAREQLREARIAMANSLGEGHPDLRWCDRLLGG